MVKVSMEVRNGAARFKVMVRASSIERAVSLLSRRYPDSQALVKFPADPEGLFAGERDARARPAVLEAPGRMAA